MPAEPNWIVTALIGAVLGALVVPVGRLAVYPVRRVRPHRLAGSWFTYHYSFVNDKATLRYGLLTVSTGVTQRYTVALHTSAKPITDQPVENDPRLTYRGKIVPDDKGHLVIVLAARSHEELLVYRFINRIPSNAEVIPGLWMAYDHDGRPAAGCEILSRTRLSDGVAQSQLRKFSRLDEHGILRI